MDLGEVGESRRFTREDLRRMIDAGILGDDEHVELLNGRLVVTPPQGPPHTYSSTLLHHRLLAAYGDRALVRESKPLDCGEEHVPEPDVAVVRGSVLDYATRDPRGDEAILIVEVSRTTHAVDRGKAAIYARAGVPVYWLVDLVARRVEVHAQPTTGDRYSLVRVVAADETLELPLCPDRWLVRDLLPP